MLQHRQVTSFEDAFKTIEVLFHPKRDLVEVQKQSVSIQQNADENLASLVGRLCVAAREFETVLGNLSDAKREDMVKEQFKRSVMELRVRDQLADVDADKISMSDLLVKAQRLETYYKDQDDSKASKGKVVRGIGQTTEIEGELHRMKEDQRKAQEEQLQTQQAMLKQMGELQKQLEQMSTSRKARPFRGKCFNCSQIGHGVADCKVPKDQTRINQNRQELSKRFNRQPREEEPVPDPLN